MAVFAENSPAVVEAAARVLGLPLSHCFRMRLPSHNKHGLPEPAVEGPLTLRCALARCADLLSAPNKAALLALAACAKDAGEAARLQHLASIEGGCAVGAWTKWWDHARGVALGTPNSGTRCCKPAALGSPQNTLLAVSCLVSCCTLLAQARTRTTSMC